MVRVWVLYFFQDEPGEGLQVPNCSQLETPTSEVRLADFKAAIHKSLGQGIFHFRFQLPNETGGFLWQDAVSPEDVLPIIKGCVIAKILRLDRPQRSKPRLILKPGAMARLVTPPSPGAGDSQRPPVPPQRDRTVAPAEPLADPAPVHKRHSSSPNLAGSQNRQSELDQQQAAAVADLLSFGSGGGRVAPTRPSGGAAPAQAGSDIQHAPNTPAAPPKTRTEELQERYQRLQNEQKRVWDDVEQRWKAVETPGAGERHTAAPVKGVHLDEPVDPSGKDESVVQAMIDRREKMKDAQQHAVEEIRNREQQKKQDEESEMVLRQRLDPILKNWSEEYGKKKNIRALLAGMHTVLWEGASWKPVSMADLLEPRRVKVNYQKAVRVVHPDRTMSLDLEKRFLAKRVFDALTQAFTDFQETA